MEKLKNIPALRFPEYTGVWEKKRLRELTTLITKGTTPRKFTESGIKFIKIECFLGDKIITEKCLFIDEKTHNKELRRSILNEGDILFAIAGATIGKCSIVTKEILPANTNQALSLIRLNENENKLFVYHCLKSDKMLKYIIDTISVGAQPNLNLEQMGNFSFSLPPTLPEQTKIATFLTAVDERLNQLKQKKTLLEQYKKGVMQKIFDQEIRFRDDEGNEFPEWEVKSLNEVCEKIQDGNYGGDYPKASEFIKEGIPFLTSKAIGQDGSIAKDKIDYISEEKHKQLKKAHLKLNDVLFTNRGSNVGTIGLVNEKIAHGNIGPQLTLLRGKKEIYHLYLKEIMSSFIIQKQVSSQNSGSAMNFFGIGETSQFKILLPCYPEQTKIANFLSAIDEKINCCTDQISKTDQYKKGLLQQMFV